MSWIIFAFLIAVCGISQCTTCDADEACNPMTRPKILNGTLGGVITSPNYPEDYPDNSWCEWLIKGEDTVGLQFTLTDILMEQCTLCKCDGIEVYAGNQTNLDNLIALYCGEETGDPAELTEGIDILVLFRSDDSITAKGFEATYSVLDSACIGVGPRNVMDSNGFISSMYYPANYPKYANCEWTLLAPEGTRIELIFDDFETEFCCTCDFVQIFDGSSKNARSFGKWFGENTNPPRIVSSTNALHILFESDYAISGRGFLARYAHIE